MTQDVCISFATPLTIIHQSVGPPQPAQPQLIPVFTLTVNEFTFTGASITMTPSSKTPSGATPSSKQAQPMQAAASMPAGTLGTLSVEWHAADGSTAKVDGPTDWVSSDPTIVQVEVAAGNPQIANIYAPGPIGKVSVQATADADLGEGVQKVTATIDVTVIAGMATSGDITFTQGPQGPPSPGGPS